jgi:hypothetical protein
VAICLKLLQLIRKFFEKTDILGLRLATGKVDEIPFPKEMLIEGRRIMKDELMKVVEKEDMLKVHEGQPFLLNLIAAFLEACEDPDVSLWDTGP